MNKGGMNEWMSSEVHLESKIIGHRIARIFLFRVSIPQLYGVEARQNYKSLIHPSGGPSTRPMGSWNNYTFQENLAKLEW